MSPAQLEEEVSIFSTNIKEPSWWSNQYIHLIREEGLCDGCEILQE